ncbi:Cas10/Cmr2 second palm domain-containing protein [Candidatus Methylacidiphilum infernorum]|uniref:Predicted CRISPR-associated polymerase n=1 Tax=Methylacidiphilum infernorum (isolate V4) TaxID=481448 RepID=B3DUD4_METI4|nr:hypothetical protein [Candidatus Methylacidiphilum infernorum]ACD82937.1 Predicted CRISPR-associated polymerase [Methylacidiphilum infernorum V4]
MSDCPSASKLVKLELEFKRIQAYLFASPRLRAMLGANSILGQTIRVHLPDLAKNCGAKADPTIAEKLPERKSDDPLNKSSSRDELLADDPRLLYKRTGVLVRDGGHFIATFPSENTARSFLEKAYNLIGTKLPGIMVDAWIEGQKEPGPSLGTSLFQHPAFQVSHHLGNRPAAPKVQQKQQQEQQQEQFLSDEEKELEERGRSYRENPADLIGLLEKERLIPTPTPDKQPKSLEDLEDNRGYIALIYADGNGIGNRYQQWKRHLGDVDRDGSLASEAHGEEFFLSMRVAVRKALTQSLSEVFGKDPDKDPNKYQLLMLGGDDLLLVCAATYALPFVTAYARKLSDLPLCDGEPLTIGTGVTFAKSKFPFYRLHEMAVSLADSAKRLYRAKPEVRSVVDWHLTTNSWVNDPIAERRADSLVGNTVLSNKPYPILGEKGLCTLLESVDKIKYKIKESQELSRSQLRQLVEKMRIGRTVAELAWAELPEEMGKLLEGELRPFVQTYLFSFVPDIVEIYEILRK